MKIKLTAIFIALLFIGTATLTATANGKPVKIRFSGTWGTKEFGKMGRVKGTIKIFPRKVIVTGRLCYDNKKPVGCKFFIKLIENKKTCGTEMLNGLFKGHMRCQWDCKETCCDEVICCHRGKGPFNGDWFFYQGWLMIMGNWYGHKVWFKAYVGSWSYPGIECYA